MNDLEKIRQALQNTTSSNLEDYASFRPAAVLVPLFYKNKELHLLLTKRTEKVEHHKGEVSFPGGAKDQSDPDLLFTALRETEEEINISSDCFEILGSLRPITTVTDFVVIPYVGWMKNADCLDNLKANPFEIEKFLEVPLAHLTKPNNYVARQSFLGDESVVIHFWDFKDDIIWGATGRIIFSFLKLLELEKNLLPKYKHPVKISLEDIPKVLQDRYAKNLNKRIQLYREKKGEK
ncbi:MAG: NUDIX hydrolase [Promethearchaeota archaeon]